MKGIVFTEFLAMVDEKISPATTERIIESSDLLSGGAYTNVGIYDHSEMVTLVTALSKETGCSISELLFSFGHHLIGRFRAQFPAFFDESEDVYDFLQSVDQHIHVEVRKLYPDAELPTLTTTRASDGSLVLEYLSDRHLGDLAEGLIAGAIDEFDQPAEIIRNNSEDKGSSQCVRFTVKTAASQAA